MPYNALTLSCCLRAQVLADNTSMLYALKIHWQREWCVPASPAPEIGTDQPTIL